MKKLTFFCISILFVNVIFSQKARRIDLDSLTFEMANDIDFTKTLKNGSTVKYFLYENGLELVVGNKLILNEPSDDNSSSYFNGASGSVYSTIFLGEFKTVNLLLDGFLSPLLLKHNQ